MTNSMTNSTGTTKEYLEMASKLRKVAHDLSELKKKKLEDKREKCAAVIVAKVGLTELLNNLKSSRR